MKAELYLDLPSIPDLPIRVARVRGGQLEEVAPSALNVSSRTKAVAFAPALAVARFRILLPARSESEARKAALFAIEDDLAQPVEDVAVTLGPRAATGNLRDLYVVDRVLLRSWLAALQAMGLDEVQIIPEASVTPASPCVYHLGDRLLLSARDRTIGADADLPEDALRALITAAALDHAPVVHGDALRTLAHLHETNPGLCLDGPDGAPARNRNAKGYRAWFTAAALALVVSVLWIAGVWLDARNLTAAADAQETAARAQYRALFPAAPDPVDIHTEVRRQSQRAEAAPRSSFQSLATAVYAAIAGSDTIRLVRLAWSASDQTLHADLHFASRADETAFLSRLQSAGWASETTTSTDTAAGFDATITVRAQP